MSAGPRVAMVQDGARLHYALPLALHRAGLLERAFCEFYAPPGSGAAALANLIARVRPALGRRMAQRYSAELPDNLVVRNPWLLVPHTLARLGAPDEEALYRRWTDVTGRWVRRVGLGRADTLIGFVRNLDPRLCRYARRRGLTVVADQMIAPAAVQNREARIQEERWPGWAPPLRGSAAAAIERETWAACHHLTAASEYVRDGLAAEGVDPAKVSVLPYPVALGEFRPTERPAARRPMTVGFVGGVNLRKGAPYFFETARRLPPDEFRLVMVGHVDLFPDALAKQKGAVEVLGGRSRQEVARLLDGFDAFYFPSTCEGSAGSVMEAMTAGLPVVCSPNTGSVVRDGVDGFLVAYDDTERAADCLVQLARDPERRLAMGRSAAARAASFDLDWYSRELAAVLRRVGDASEKRR